MNLTPARRDREPYGARVKRIATLLIGALLLTSCSATPTPQKPSTAPPAGVSVFLTQQRSDEPLHALEISVRNATDTPVYFADVQLLTESFKTLPPARIDTTFRRTEQIDLRVPYGEAVCDPRAVPPVKPATVAATISTSGGPLRKVVFTVTHPDPLLTRLMKVECSAYLVTQAVDMAWGQGWQEVGDVLRGTVKLTRRPGSTSKVTLQAIDPTTHYDVKAVDGKGRPMLVLEPPAGEAGVEVQIRPMRCDGHAFAEAKKAFLFPFRVSLDADEERVVVVVPPKAVQDRFNLYMVKACGVG